MLAEGDGTTVIAAMGAIISARNHRPDYSPGNFDEKNEGVNAARTNLDLYSAGSDPA